jgi:iron complex outermembrane receptor protein
MRLFGKSGRARLMMGAAAGALLISSGAASAQNKAPINIAPQSLASALYEFGGVTGRQVMFTPGITASKTTAGVSAETDEQMALAQLLQGTGLTFRREANVFVIVRADADPQGGSVAGGGAEVEGLIVTAQKREEDIQDVPIAMSAFTQEALEKSQIAGGPDLMTQVPNMTFTKTNFSGYSIQIRGIGTQAISATTDPAVAVAFNNTPFVRNRFFEQEFYDLQRIEVLRGPQGTLYGRNATAGVVNLISAKPKFAYEAKLSGDLGNYNSRRLEGMVNFPIVEDMVALRLAGAWTQRDGYAINAFTGNPIDGRDLWSTRVSLRFTPTDDLDVNFIWEHFGENDDRIRSGKQLCKKDPNKTSLNGVAFPVEAEPGVNSSKLGTYNQGCIAASLYSPESFQTPNGFALPYIHPLKQLGLPATTGMDPYANSSQSRDLRVIESLVDPEYRAQANITELQVSWDFSDYLTLQSETAYSTDEVFSTQDYNRFITARGIFSQAQYDDYEVRLGTAHNVVNDGVFCDPQIGCSDRLVAVDLSTAQSTNFSQELRVSSDYEGPVNFSLGANFTRYDTVDKYYVFINSLSLWAALRGRHNELDPEGAIYTPGVTTNSACIDPIYGDPNVVNSLSDCIYMDPNPISSLNDLGHNYFLSKNPYRLISYAAFGELYYNVTETLKITGGLRYTIDKKHAPLVPSWLLASETVGYPVKEILDLEWREPSGRLAIDWKPDLGFTDETLLYASFAHGYKAGGANPPPMVVVAGQLSGREGVVDSVLHPQTFDAEFVDAFEVGSKNTLFDGRMTLNASAFYYDYKGYQISQIIDRSAVNSNFDAEVWGLEIEADWRPLENLRFGFKGGYEKTRLADGSEAIDLMDRTAGHTDWVVAKPFPSLASNCILPVSLVTSNNRINTLWSDGSGGVTLGDVGFCVHAYLEGLDPVTLLPYVLNPTVRDNATLGDPNGTAPIGAHWAGYAGFDPASAPNNGEGFTKDLSGNELPNAPHFTGTLTADYTLPLRGAWLVNFHADLYYQSEAWLRVFNTEGYDKLKAYTNLNLAAIFTNEEAGWKVMAYVKNVMDRDSITGAFLNSDDSGLTTNVFLTEPRLYGLRVTKDFSNVPLLGSLLERRAQPGGAYPFTVEIGGGAARYSGDVENYAPEWLELYSDEFPGPLAIDDEELDWGDTREVTLAYTLPSDWRVSAAYRVGKTNGGDRKAGYEFVPGGSVPSLLGGWLYNTSPPNHWIGTVTDQEQYEVIDFMVGKELGLGLLGEDATSVVSAGVRYADFRSASQVEMDGVPDRYSPEEFSATGKYGLPTRHWDAFTYALDSERSFEGVGPFLSWDASLRLFGDDVQGRADLDWSVGGGVLFGKQTVDSQEDRLARYFILDTATGGQFASSTPIDDVVPRHRSEKVTVPNVSLSLGVSYAIDRVKVSTGYAYDRFFDVIDGGYEEAQQFDRTIHGPYLKLSLGFGG